MAEFLDIKCLPPEESRRIEAEIEKRIEAKKKEGLITEREVREVEVMRLNPLLDILDIQSLWEDHLYKT
ncbi:MAG: hypothetical protein MUP19_06325 [Candidatus Aminicenantes bacterium]|nr:hypothetical protein [Candidatus Aminicenantes bacterium]